jgi:hypothetical protein
VVPPARQTLICVALRPDATVRRRLPARVVDIATT